MEIYIEEVNEALVIISKSLKDENVTSFKKVIHKIKPSLEMVGLLDIKTKIETYEQGEASLTKMKHLCEAILPSVKDSVEIVETLRRQ